MSGLAGRGDMARCIPGAGALAWERTGRGAPVLLLHGLGGERHGWQPLLERLAGEFELWAIDLPGFGGSPPLPAAVAPGPEELAEAAAGFVRAHALPSPLPVVGHSLGGWIALELARRGLASSVVAIAPGGWWTERERRRTSALLRASVRLARALRPLVPRLLRPAPLRTLLLAHMVHRPWRMPAPAAVRAVQSFAAAPGFDATLAAIDRPGCRLQRPEEIASPVTLVWGRDDLLLPVRQSRRAASRLPRLRALIRLPRCGHAVMWDAPAALAGAVRAALGHRACRRNTPD
ncbi:MAG: hydrolase [Planctomycetota bacterium]|nr:MAG: hydrolase [Planctomycetota bacterium]